MKPFKIVLAALVVVLAAAVVYGYGCGGGDDTSGGESTPAAKAGGGQQASPATTGSSEGSSGGDGSDGGDGGDGGSVSSKAAFIKQGDAVCQKVPKRYQATVAKLEKEGKKQGKAKVSPAEANLKAGVPPLYKAIEELEGLSAPSGDAQQVEAIIDALGAAAKGLEEKPTSELAGPKSPFGEFQKLTKEYGFQFCNQL